MVNYFKRIRKELNFEEKRKKINKSGKKDNSKIRNK